MILEDHQHFADKQPTEKTEKDEQPTEKTLKKPSQREKKS